MKLFKFTEFINEGQFYQDQLNPMVWDGEEINPELRTKLLQIAHDFYEDLKVNAPIEDIQLTGSLANYNWTKYSDFDVHVIMDLSKINQDVELVKIAMEGLKTVWNQRHPVNIGGYDVELYAQDVNQLHLASGLYSLLKGEWLRKPEYSQPTVDPKDVQVKSDHYIYAIKQMVEEIQGAGPEEAKDLMGNTVVVMGPDVEGGRRLFVFYVDWAREVERAGRWVNMVGLTSPMIIRQEGGNLVAKPVAFNPQTLQKYAGLSDYQVVLNSKTKTPFWFETVKFSNHVQMIRALSNQLMGIPGVKLPQS